MEKNKEIVFEIIKEWLNKLDTPKTALVYTTFEKPVMFKQNKLLRWPTYLQYKRLVQEAETHGEEIRYATKSHHFHSIDSRCYKKLRDIICAQLPEEKKLLTTNEIVKKYLTLYIKEKIFNNKDIIICWNRSKLDFFSLDYIMSPSAVILMEDIVQLHDLPDAIKNRYLEGKANDKVYDLAVKPVLDEIAKSIGAEVKHYGVSKNTKAIYFPDYNSFQKFVQQALCQALESKLKETGLEFNWTNVMPREGSALVTVKIPNYATKGEDTCKSN